MSPELFYLQPHQKLLQKRTVHVKNAHAHWNLTADVYQKKDANVVKMLADVVRIVNVKIAHAHLNVNATNIYTILLKNRRK